MAVDVAAFASLLIEGDKNGGTRGMLPSLLEPEDDAPQTSIHTLNSACKRAAPINLELHLLDDLETGMTLLLSDNEQRLTRPYDEEPHIANLFVPQLSVKGGSIGIQDSQQERSLKASEILRNETTLAKCSAQTSEAGLPASGQVRRLAGRRCAIRRSMPVIDDVRRIDLADPEGQNGLALSMGCIAEIYSYKPFEEGKHMTL